MKTIVVLFALLLLVCARDNPSLVGKYKKTVNKPLIGNGQMHWFDQVTDHYDYRAATYWNQRYWVASDSFTPRIGPVFYIICGQYNCDGVFDNRQWVFMLAQRLQGIVITLEHRFYGQSLPFGKDSFSMKNMALLNSELALRDLAYFQETVVRNQMFGITNNPWICVGGSYPGALSAWYRYKYPHLVIGAIASSAVIIAIEDFHEFDEQIYLSSQKSGDYCSNALNASNARVEQILDSGASAANTFKSQFPGGDKLNNNEFLFFWADAIVLTIQYGGRTDICNKLKDKTSDQQFSVLVQNAKDYPVYQYGSFYLKNQTFTYETKSMARPWYYQYCSEYAFFQTYSLTHPMRSKRLDLSFYTKFCEDSFGPGIYPKVWRKNTEYGGLHQKSTNILFANGIEDPWRWASLQNTTTPGLIARVADCPNCAHCVDLQTPDFDDSDALKKIRDEQFLTVSDWIDTYWQKTQKEAFEKILFQMI